MKRVLIIAHLIRASPRIPGLAKYLPEFGWQPIILTARLDQKPDQPYRIIETPYHETLGLWRKLFRFPPDEDMRRQVKARFGVTARKSPLDFILTRIGEIVNYPDPDKGWQAFAIAAGDRVLREEGIDALISSSSPVTAHVIANKLKLRHGKPWIADLRDLWTQNHNYSYSNLRRSVDRRLELKTLSTADALVTVSQPWEDKLVMLHKGKATYVITNGFDPETVNVPPAKLTARFTITYTGAIYAGKQDPTLVLRALQDLAAEGGIDLNDIEVRFYGPVETWLEKEAERCGLSNVTRQYGPVPRDIALQKQRESQLLLLLDWDDPQEKGTYPGKVFEYLATGRPILATGGSADGVIAKLLAETGAGIHAPTLEQTKSALRTLYLEFKSGGSLASRGDEAKFNRYSYREMARKFGGILDRLAGPATGQPR